MPDRQPEPGTVTLIKGEPSAKDMFRLRLDLSDDERARLRHYLSQGPASARGEER